MHAWFMPYVFINVFCIKLQNDKVTGTGANNKQHSHAGAKWNCWMLRFKKTPQTENNYELQKAHKTTQNTNMTGDVHIT